MSSTKCDKFTYEGFSDEEKQYLTKELNEIPSRVNAHIESFRRWLTSMPHLRCPTDAEFLLRFLRVSKFDHEKAQRRLDNFCTVRSSPRGALAFFDYFKLGDSQLETLLDSKFMFLLGQLTSGELVVLFRFNSLNSLSFTPEGLSKFIFMTLDVLAEKRESQIYGIKYLADLENVDRKVMEIMADTKALKVFYKAWQDSYPLRIKGQMFFNASPIVDIFFKMVYFFMNSKMKSRTSRVAQDMKKLMEMQPGLMDILPKEYNGLGGTLNECAERWKKSFTTYFAGSPILESIHVDESKRPKDTLTYLADHPDYTEETYGAEGTFTKFDVF